MKEGCDDLKTPDPIMEKVSRSRKKFFFETEDLKHVKSTSNVPP